MKHLKLKMPTDFAALILGVLSHLLIRDWHNCGSCEAISSSLNLIADYHSPESPYSPRSQIPNASVAALAAVAIFKPSSCRWTYWIINKLRSSRTDDVIRLASPRHQLCILDVCQRGGVLSPSLYCTFTPPSADTNWCSKPHARIMESLRDPTLVCVQVDRKGAALRRTPSAPTLWKSNWNHLFLGHFLCGGIKGGGGFNSSSGKDRIEFRGSRREWPPHTHRLLIAGCAISITFQCWVDKKIKWG